MFWEGPYNPFKALHSQPKPINHQGAVDKMIEVVRIFVEKDKKFSKIDISLVEELLKHQTWGMLPRITSVDCIERLVIEQLNFLRHKSKKYVDSVDCVDTLAMNFRYVNIFFGHYTPLTPHERYLFTSVFCLFTIFILYVAIKHNDSFAPYYG